MLFSIILSFPSQSISTDTRALIPLAAVQTLWIIFYTTMLSLRSIFSMLCLWIFDVGTEQNRSRGVTWGLFKLFLESLYLVIRTLVQDIVVITYGLEVVVAQVLLATILHLLLLWNANTWAPILTVARNYLSTNCHLKIFHPKWLKSSSCIEGHSFITA